MADLVVLEPHSSSVSKAFPQTPAEWASDIAYKWNATVESILATAQRVIEADKALSARPADATTFTKECEKRGLSDSTLSKLRSIGTSERFLGRKAELKCLPASYNYLYDLARLDDRDYTKVYTKLTEGEEYREAIKVLRSKRGKRNKRQRLLFTFSVEPDKLNSADKEEIQTFVETFIRRQSKVSIRVSPTYKQMFADDEE